MQFDFLHLASSTGKGQVANKSHNIQIPFPTPEMDLLEPSGTSPGFETDHSTELRNWTMEMDQEVGPDFVRKGSL